MTKSLFGICMVLVLGCGLVIAEETAPSAEKPAAPASQPTTQASKPVNTKCPVSNDDIDPKGKTVVYEGKTIGFCCDDCIKSFNKNPKKYAENLK